VTTNTTAEVIVKMRDHGGDQNGTERSAPS
jgi:hypothetical protein